MTERIHIVRPPRGAPPTLTADGGWRWYLLYRWANSVRGLYGVPVHLVGSALRRDNPDPRDWDIRLTLPDNHFALRYGPVEEWRDEGHTGNWTRIRLRWSDDCVKQSRAGARQTKLNIDFQLYPRSYVRDYFASLPRLRVDTHRRLRP